MPPVENCSRSGNHRALPAPRDSMISMDNEAFTYNERVNRLAIIQEHRMILKAIERGVSEERIAKALNVDVGSINRKRRLLDEICPDPDPISAGTAGEAALWGGSSAAVGMAANPFGAHQAGPYI